MMRPRLQDLRFLHMAKDLETMFEGLEKAFERHIPRGAVRDALEPIFNEGPSHRRLQQAYNALNADVAAHAANVSAVDLLEAILGCERAARAFYLDNAPHLSDPALADLFRALAQEEEQHIVFVERALQVQRSLGD